MKEQNKDRTPKIRKNKLKSFFRSFLFVGIILILLSVIIEQVVLPIKGIADIKILHIIIRIGVLVMNSIGIALLVGYWIDMVKRTEDYILFINQQLQDTIVERNFIQSLDYSEKLKICENLICPESQEINNNSNIRTYMKSQSESFLDFFNVNFRNNYIVDVVVKKEKDKYIAEYSFSYRIYKINNKYQPVSIVFEKKSEFVSTVIRDNNNKSSMTITKDDYKQLDAQTNKKEYVFEIPDKYYNCEFLTIERKIKEYGHSHWITLNWSNLTPIDGIYFELRCDNGIIKEYYMFNDPNAYIMEMSDAKKEIKIQSHQWLDSYSGFSIIIADPSDDDDFFEYNKESNKSESSAE